MRVRLGCVFACVLLVGADTPQAQLGEAKVALPPRSKWVLVRGWEGESTLEVGALNAGEQGGLKLQWAITERGFWSWEGTTRSGEGAILRADLFGLRHTRFRTAGYYSRTATMRFVGERLEVRMTVPEAGRRDVDVCLRFKRVR
jgi:hypothetical protein